MEDLTLPSNVDDLVKLLNETFPEKSPERTSRTLGSWRNLAFTMWNGDPFSLKTDSILPNIEPEFFRKGAGTWGGKPTW